MRKKKKNLPMILAIVVGILALALVTFGRYMISANKNKAQEGAEEKPQDASQEKVREKRKASVPKTYVRYDEGAELYSMCRHTFMKLAAETGAVYKINRLSLVNTKIFDDYLELFRVPGLYSDPMSYSRRGR